LTEREVVIQTNRFHQIGEKITIVFNSHLRKGTAIIPSLAKRACLAAGRGKACYSRQG